VEALANGGQTGPRRQWRRARGEGGGGVGEEWVVAAVVLMGVQEQVYVGQRREERYAGLGQTASARSVLFSLRRVGWEGRMKQRCDGERQGSAQVATPNTHTSQAALAKRSSSLTTLIYPPRRPTATRVSPSTVAEVSSQSRYAHPNAALYNGSSSKRSRIPPSPTP
jgi:hypothetical protein